MDLLSAAAFDLSPPYMEGLDALLEVSTYQPSCLCVLSEEYAHTNILPFHFSIRGIETQF